ncbi:EAL domain-containing protein [Persephonella sp.]
MRYAEVLKEFLPSVFQEIRENIFNEPEILHFVGSEEKLQTLLNRQEEVLTEYLETFPEGSGLNMEKLKKFYGQLDIPFVVVLRNINLIKIKLLERLSIEKELSSKDYLLQIKSYIEKLENVIAYVYLKKDVKQLKDNEQTIFRKYLLYSANMEYAEKVMKAVEEENLTVFPVESPDECDFHRYLFYPESIMACMDANLCVYIEELHEMIHKIANSMFVFLINKKYVDAYMAFKELLDNILKMSKTLSELYFLAYSDAEGNFFKLVEYLENTEKTKFVYMLDIKNLKSLNRIYNEKNVNSVIKQIHQKLSDFVEPKKENLLLVRGTTATFYLLALGIDKTQAKELAYQLKGQMDGSYRLNGNYIEIQSTVSMVEIEKYTDSSKEELIRVLFHLKEEAKKRKDSVVTVTEEKEKEKLREWLTQRYRNNVFIQEKIGKRELSVIFQPIYDTFTGKIFAVEALSRIQGENGRLVPAGVFIDAVYELGLITTLDSVMLDKISEKKTVLSKISQNLFINISSESLNSPEFVKKLKQFVRDMEGFNIFLEITEQKLVENTESLQNLLSEFSHVSFAIDDFGSGYSSLKTVADLAEHGVLKVLKIDGSLIKDLSARKFSKKVVRAIASMVESLGIHAVAEFVENQEVLNLLKEMNIKYSQGYYLSRPKTAEEILVEQLSRNV